MRKSTHLLTVVLRGFVGPSISQGTSKGGRKSVKTTCC
jgi:hypothetical protein